MMAYPQSQVATTALDADSDNLLTARQQILALAQALNEMITSYGQALGVCELDAGGLIPASRLPAGSGAGVDADLLDGQHGDYYRNAGNLNAGTLPAVRFADSSHGSRSGGALHAAATQAVAGFMSATDKQALDGMAGSIAAATTTTAINSKIAATAVYAVGSYIAATYELTSNVNPGATVAGSHLRPADLGGNWVQEDDASYGSGISGTWRCMGYLRGYPAAGENAAYYGRTLWLRIA